MCFLQSNFFTNFNSKVATAHPTAAELQGIVIKIKPVLSMVKHQQTNGKIEKWFDAYQRFRKYFSSFKEFIEWYNNGPYGISNFKKVRCEIIMGLYTKAAKTNK